MCGNIIANTYIKKVPTCLRKSYHHMNFQRRTFFFLRKLNSPTCAQWKYHSFLPPISAWPLRFAYLSTQTRYCAHESSMRRQTPRKVALCDMQEQILIRPLQAWRKPNLKTTDSLFFFYLFYLFCSVVILVVNSFVQRWQSLTCQYIYCKQN